MDGPYCGRCGWRCGGVCERDERFPAMGRDARKTRAAGVGPPSWTEGMPASRERVGRADAHKGGRSGVGGCAGGSAGGDENGGGGGGNSSFDNGADRGDNNSQGYGGKCSLSRRWDGCGAPQSPPSPTGQPFRGFLRRAHPSLTAMVCRLRPTNAPGVGNGHVLRLAMVLTVLSAGILLCPPLPLLPSVDEWLQGVRAEQRPLLGISGGGADSTPAPRSPPLMPGAVSTEDPFDVVPDEGGVEAELARLTAVATDKDGPIGGAGRPPPGPPLRPALEVHTLPPVPVGDRAAGGAGLCRSSAAANGGRASHLNGRPTFCRLHHVGVHANGSLLLPAWMDAPATRAALRRCGLPPLTFASGAAGAPSPPPLRSLYGSATRDLFLLPGAAPVRDHIPHFLSDVLLPLAAPAAFPRVPAWGGNVTCYAPAPSAGGVVTEAGTACAVGGGAGRTPLRLVLAGVDKLVGGTLVSPAGRWVRGLLSDIVRGDGGDGGGGAGVEVQLWKAGQVTGADEPTIDAADGRPLPVLYRSLLSTDLTYNCVPEGLFPPGAPVLAALGLPRRRPLVVPPPPPRRRLHFPRVRRDLAPRPPPPFPPPCVVRVGVLLRPPPRVLVDAGAVLGRLASHAHLNVTALRFDVSSFRRQKEAAAAQDVLVGAHGAGLTNGVFLRPRVGEILEVTPWGMTAPPYAGLAAAFGVAHTLHVAAPDVSGYAACVRAAAAAAAPGPGDGAGGGGGGETKRRGDLGAATACTALADAYVRAVADATRAATGWWPGEVTAGVASTPSPPPGTGGWGITQPPGGGGCPAAFRCARNLPLVVDVDRLEADVLAVAARVCARQALAEGP